MTDKKHNLHALTDELIDKGKRYYVPNYSPREMILDRGEGATIWDLDGNDYIDLGSGIAVNSLWPMTAIDTAAVRNVLGGDALATMSRTPEIMADAAYEVLIKEAKSFTGHFVIDEEILREAGVTDFSGYAPGYDGALAGDFFVPDEVFDRTPTKIMRLPGH